jgi:hypothetical protein
MKRLAMIGAFSALAALPLAAQQPAPRDTASSRAGHRAAMHAAMRGDSTGATMAHGAMMGAGTMPHGAMAGGTMTGAAGHGAMMGASGHGAMMNGGVMGPGAMRGGMMGGGMMYDSVMGAAMMARNMGLGMSPEHLLGMQPMLGLTAQQTGRLTALRDSDRATEAAAVRTAQMHLRELRQAMQAAAPDTAAVREHIDAIHTALQDAQRAMLGSAAQARAVLTDTQRRQADSTTATDRKR